MIKLAYFIIIRFAFETTGLICFSLDYLIYQRE